MPSCASVPPFVYRTCKAQDVCHHACKDTCHHACLPPHAIVHAPSVPPFVHVRATVRNRISKAWGACHHRKCKGECHHACKDACHRASGPRAFARACVQGGVCVRAHASVRAKARAKARASSHASAHARIPPAHATAHARSTFHHVCQGECHRSCIAHAGQVPPRAGCLPPRGAHAGMRAPSVHRTCRDACKDGCHRACHAPSTARTGAHATIRESRMPSSFVACASLHHYACTVCATVREPRMPLYLHCTCRTRATTHTGTRARMHANVESHFLKFKLSPNVGILKFFELLQCFRGASLSNQNWKLWDSSLVQCTKSQE
ncbi:hypothetical protein AAG906_020733 [Vitis piasezkii]